MLNVNFFKHKTIIGLSNVYDISVWFKKREIKQSAN